MSTRITEILRVKVNDAFASDDSLFEQLRAGASKSGVKQQAYGLNIEDPKELFWLLFFEEGIQPKDFVWPSEYGTFEEKFGTIAAGAPISNFFPLNPPVEAVTAPVTEFGFVTLKQSVKQEDVKSFIASTIETAKAAPGCLGGDWAFADDDDRKIGFVLGWESVEAHVKLTETDAFRKEGQVLQTFMAKGEVFHVKLSSQL